MFENTQRINARNKSVEKLFIFDVFRSKVIRNQADQIFGYLTFAKTIARGAPKTVILEPENSAFECTPKESFKPFLFDNPLCYNLFEFLFLAFFLMQLKSLRILNENEPLFC